MNYVFSVVQHDGFRRLARVDLVSDERVVEMIEAIGFRRRPVCLDLHCNQSLFGDAGDRRCGRRVVSVIADEDPVIIIVEAFQRCLQHRGDDCRFIPGGDQDRYEPGILVENVVAGVSATMAPVYGERPPKTPREIDHIDGEVIQPKQQESHAREERKFGGDARDNVGSMHECSRGVLSQRQQRS